MLITSHFFLILLIMVQGSFKESQLKHARVKNAYEEIESSLKRLLMERDLSFTDLQLFIQAFKKEQVVEIWAKGKQQEKFRLLIEYNFCITSGKLGPKRKEGDLQIPEGVYHINHFNPLSNFHLSLGINYPNASDKILADKHHPGGSIYIHGNCVTIGCIPITDEKIKELYLLAVEARNGGQEKIPIHIFPARLDAKGFDALKREYADQNLIAFWHDLQKIYASFEESKTLKIIKVDEKGKYLLSQN